MVDSCKEHGIPTPKFSERVGGFLVKFQFAEPMGAPIKNKENEIELSSRQKAILATIKKHQVISTKKIMSELINPPSLRMVRRTYPTLNSKG